MGAQLHTASGCACQQWHRYLSINKQQLLLFRGSNSGIGQYVARFALHRIHSLISQCNAMQSLSLQSSNFHLDFHFHFDIPLLQHQAHRNSSNYDHQCGLGEKPSNLQSVILLHIALPLISNWKYLFYDMANFKSIYFHLVEMNDEAAVRPKLHFWLTSFHHIFGKYL